MTESVFKANDNSHYGMLTNLTEKFDNQQRDVDAKSILPFDGEERFICQGT